MSSFAERDSGSYKGILAALVLCQMGLHANMHGMRVAVPLQALHLGYTAMTVGILVACFAIVPAFFAIAFGRFTDRAGFHLPIRLAAVLCIAAGLSLAMSDSVPALCVGAACSGAGSGFGMIAIQRTASRLTVTSADRIKVFSWIALAPALAGLIGPTLAGVVIDHKGFRIAFALLGVLPLITLVISQWVPVEPPSGQTKAGRKSGKVMDLLKDHSLQRLLFVNWLVAASWDAHGFVIPILGHIRGFTASEVGYIFAAFGAASIVARLAIPLFAHRLSTRLLMSGGIGLAAVAFAIYPLLEPAWAMVCCAFVFGISLGCVQPSILATLHEVAPPERHGEALAIRSTMSQVSMTTMPLAFGVIGVSLGASLLLWVMAGALATGVWQSQRLFK